MQIISLFITVLVCVVSILVVLVQQYYMYINLTSTRKSTDVKPYGPVFEDMIVSADDADSRFYILELPQERLFDNYPYENEILNTLDEVLRRNGANPIQTNTIILNNNNLYDTTESEVCNVLKAASEFKAAGKIDKASKIYRHALAMAPNNPDVLNRYGEFVEHMRNDIIAADELYFQALSHAPSHNAALTNRGRTAHIVDKLDLRILKRIDEKRDALMKIQETKPFFDLVKKQAYYLHIYHTVGIEGNTMTLIELRRMLETGQVVPGRSIMEHNEILGLELAMKYVKLLIRFPFIDVNEILGIHRRVLGHVDPLNSGVFRDKQVFVGNHMPPPPEDIPYLMESYVEWLNSEDAQSMHPVRYAALAHYKFVDIHPFSDGNGRTSRLIMNLILLRAGYPPVMILKYNREKYYHYLNIANSGDVRPFVRFMAECVENTLNVYIWAVERLYKDFLQSGSRIGSWNPATIEVNRIDEVIRNDRIDEAKINHLIEETNEIIYK